MIRSLVSLSRTSPQTVRLLRHCQGLEDALRRVDRERPRRRRFLTEILAFAVHNDYERLRRQLRRARRRQPDLANFIDGVLAEFRQRKPAAPKPAPPEVAEVVLDRFATMPAS